LLCREPACRCAGGRARSACSCRGSSPRAPAAAIDTTLAMAISARAVQVPRFDLDIWCSSCRGPYMAPPWKSQRITLACGALRGANQVAEPRTQWSFENRSTVLSDVSSTAEVCTCAASALRARHQACFARRSSARVCRLCQIVSIGIAPSSSPASKPSANEVYRAHNAGVEGSSASLSTNLVKLIN
jgi:hypothetical protein